MAAAFDLLLRGGTVVSPEGLRPLDIAVRAGCIAALLPPNVPADAKIAVDVSGRLLLPGLVDAHVHLREPGLTQKEDFASGTRAAAAGGVTTLLVMPTDDPWTATPVQLADKIALTAGRLFVDVAFQVAVGKPAAALAALVEGGAVSFEIFTADVPPHFLHDTLQDVLVALRAVEAVGGMAALSPGNQSVLQAADAEPGTDIAAYLASRPPVAEAFGIAQAVLAAAETGARVHIRQSNSALGVDTLRRLKGMGDVTIETTAQCLMFSADDYPRLGGAIKASPPFRTEADVAALHGALLDRTIDMVATDHAPHTPAEKAGSHERFGDIPGGFAGVQTLLAVMLHLVADGIIALPDLVRLCAVNPAARFGLSQKGAIAVGCDADLIVLDPTRSSTVTDAEQHSKAGATPFAGLCVPFHVERVYLRGRVIDAVPTGRVLRPATRDHA